MYIAHNQVDFTYTFGALEIKVINVNNTFIVNAITNNSDIEKIQNEIMIYKIHHAEWVDEQKVRVQGFIGWVYLGMPLKTGRMWDIVPSKV